MKKSRWLGYTALVALLANPFFVLGYDIGAERLPDDYQLSSEYSGEDSHLRFLIVGKAKVIDPEDQQQRAVVAVDKMVAATRAFGTRPVIETLAEQVMTKEDYLHGGASESVTREGVKASLRRLAAEVGPEDTVVIYSHTHGYKNGFESEQPLGGILLDLPVRRSGHRGALLWDEYADLLLSIPAKTVIVLTMSCFSGGLVEYLDSPEIKEHWKNRRNEGRNFVVLTAQNAGLNSSPIMKDGEVINPFTYAVERAFLGEADGFAGNLEKTDSGSERDGKITLGEFADYVLDTTSTTVSEADSQERSLTNTAHPQITGSFDPEATVFELNGASVTAMAEARTRKRRADMSSGTLWETAATPSLSSGVRDTMEVPLAYDQVRAPQFRDGIPSETAYRSAPNQDFTSEPDPWPTPQFRQRGFGWGPPLPHHLRQRPPARLLPSQPMFRPVLPRQPEVQSVAPVSVDGQYWYIEGY